MSGSNTRPTIVGVAGSSGSGKTTLAVELVAELRAALGDASVGLLSMDSYYRDLAHLTYQERDEINFDHPDALEIPLFKAHLEQLKRGLPVDVPRYDFTTHTRAEGVDTLMADEFLIVEGILLGADETLLPLYDYLVFVDTPLDVCLSRRLERDQRERGRSEASVISFWQDRVEPMFLTHGIKASHHAHLTVPGTDDLASSVVKVLRALKAVQPA